MRCEDAREWVFEREDLESPEEQELDQHLLICGDCRLWDQTLSDVEAVLSTQLQAEVSAPDLRLRILGLVARERRKRWITAMPELLDALGWSVVGILATALLFLWSNRTDWITAHLRSTGAATLIGSLLWAAWVLWKEDADVERSF